MKQAAIILGTEHPRSVSAIQTLGRAGIPVIALDHAINPIGFHSRYPKKKISLAKAEDALSLLDRLKEQEHGVLIPTNDDYLILISRQFENLSRRFVLTTPPWDVLEPLMDLSMLYRIAAEEGVATPVLYKPKSEQDLAAILRDLDYSGENYLLKTRPGTVPADHASGRFTKVAGRDPATVYDNSMEIFSRLGEFPLIVKVIPGEADRCIGVCMVINRAHQAVVCYCVKRLKLFTYSRGGDFMHPYSLGANVFCESTHDEEATETAKRLMARLKYFGPMALEFRRDSRNARLVLIKADPRPVRATSLSTALGMDLSLALYHEFTGGKISVPASYRDGVGWIWMSAYFASLWENRLNRSVRKELFHLLREFRRIRSVANFYWRDPYPFLVEQLFWWRNFLRYLSRRLPKRLLQLIKRPVQTQHV